VNCQERSGFLFAHPCDRLAAWTCATCQKQVCDAHVRNVGGQPRCITCMKTSGVQPPPPVLGAGYYDDPYWYSHYHYHDYSYYDLDDYRAFRPRQSPATGGSTGGFENDPSAT
jgi:hypothetical protein